MQLHCLPSAPEQQQIDDAWRYVQEVEMLPSTKQLESLGRITKRPSTIQQSDEWCGQLQRVFSILSARYNKQLSDGSISKSFFPIRGTVALQPVVDQVAALCGAGETKQSVAIDVIIKCGSLQMIPVSLLAPTPEFGWKLRLWQPDHG
jgi:hypothetical protein